MVRGSSDTVLYSSGRWGTTLSASYFETSFDIVNKKRETEREREKPNSIYKIITFVSQDT